MLRVNNLNVFYGHLHVLWDVSLEVEKGEIVAVIGPNGAGKTTLLRSISRIIPIKSGEITFNGVRIDTLPPHKVVELGIVQVPEGRHLFPYLTVMQNLILGTYPKRARKNIEDTLEWVYSLFPILKERKNQVARTLSGGEQQMLAIARALMSKPELLMLDEPSQGLAPKIVLDVFNAIKKINEEGITILLVEQNVHYALKISNRAYVLENGRIVLKGNSEELLSNEYVKKAYLGI